MPGLTLSWHNENGLTNAIKITYVSQAQGDRLILADTNGWTWLGHTAGSYLAGAGDLGISTARWKVVHTQSADVDSVRFSLANISSNQSDGNLTLQAQGSGKVKFDELNFKGATISNDTGDLTFAPTEDLQVDSTNNIKIPVGETAQRPATLAGIRYNTNI